MALRDQPYIPLYIQDFLTDEKLIECSAQSKGVYVRLMCIMHKSEEYGKILLKQKDKQTDKQIKNFAIKIAKQMPYPEAVVFDSLSELLSEQVIFIEGDSLCQKRMIYDNSLSLVRSKAGKKGGNFAQAKVKANKQANSENENEVENVFIDKKSEVKNSIFSDEVFITEVKRMHAGKDLNAAFDQCWIYFSQLPNMPKDWEWRQKFTTWLIRFKPEESVEPKRYKLQ
jgi:uncharacterized protein YdaU (DUF1376 family)